VEGLFGSLDAEEKPMNDVGKHKPDPDFDRLLTVLRREGEPDRIPFLELFADLEIMEAVLNKPFPRAADLKPGVADRELEARYCDLLIEFYHTLGYDYVRAVPRGGELDYGQLATEDTASLSKGDRSWARESGGVITSWEDYEKYPWPNVKDVDYWMLEYLGDHLPEGMQLIGHGATILEPVMWLMGYEDLAIALYDQPDLLEAMFERAGIMSLEIVEAMCQFDAVGAVWISDDIGFRTGTMISPEHLRQYVFPWWKRIAECIHEHGRLVLLHACGNLYQVMDDIIDDVKVDGKHSFEDTFLPVTEAKKQYGERITLLGGVDVDFLCRSSEEQVRAYVRNVIDICGPGGGYALGTGNSVANYIPVQNYLAMLDEGRRYGVYPLTG
jgi:uroporphyrinogen decarboxylase